MTKKSLILLTCMGLFGFAILPGILNAAQANPMATTLVLYDAVSGTIPQSPNMTFASFPAVTPTYENGATVLDTTLSNSISAGWVSSAGSPSNFPTLDRGIGFQIDFTVQIDSEAHVNNNRAGFSVILLGDDKKGVELAFWENEIWAQHDSTTGAIFTHGEGVAFTTTAGLVDYQMIIVGDTYTVTADTTPILTGPVRDYTDFDGSPDPYETPNFIFLGDDTGSAQASIRLTYVSVTAHDPPVPTDTPTPTETSVTPGPSPTGTPPTSTPEPTPTPQSLEIYIPLVVKNP